MGLAGDSEENDVFKMFQELCSDLNMDKDTADEAWTSYETILQNYSLEGDQLHWLGCALHAACRNASPPTVGQSSQLIEGNLVSLTRLLRLCKLSFIQFINKIKKWADMTNLPQDFRLKVERLERNFAVSTVIFKKFQPIFAEMFLDPSVAENQKQQRTKKQKNLLCNLPRLFEFTWTLFISVKAEVPDVSDDLVNSYHLLLACCDLIYKNAILSDRRYLLNPDFSGLPSNFKDKDYIRPNEPQCIIFNLCQNHDGILMEAKSIKEYCWKNYMRKMFEKKILKGNSSDFSELLESSNFEYNLKSVNKVYEEYVLSVGDFDERIFLGEDANSEIGIPTKIIGQTGIGDFTERLQAKRNMQSQLNNVARLAPGTPLTGRDYLKSREPSNVSNVTPVSTATQSVSRLHNMLSGHQASPSQNLQQIIESCTENPNIEDKVADMGNTFCAKYTQTTVEHPESHIDFAKKRLHLATCLYYKLLENILTEEIKKPNFDCNSLLSKDIFHQTLFACCLEIVIYSYNSQRTFPWILEALNIEPYHFYKIIEIIVRAEDQLSRDMVKHLNLIEEQILESLAWTSNSSLWVGLQASNQPVPTCEDVSLPQQLSQDNDIENNGGNNNNSNTNNMNTNSAAGKTLVGLATVRKINAVCSTNVPVASASERFQSPVAVSGLTKKRLFLESPSGGLRTVKPGQSLLQNQQPQTQQVVVSTTVAANGLPVLHSQQSNSSTTPNVSAATSNSIVVNTSLTKTAISSSGTKYIPVQAIEVEDGRRYIPIAISPGSGSVLIQTRPVVTSQSSSVPSVSSVNSNQGNATPTVSTHSNSATATVEVTIPNSAGNPPSNGITNTRARRTGSLGLFFRKFYHLASVRMQELCNQLGLMQTDLRRKIWTCFEHTIVEHTDLMLNRHLDQILMCAVYVICKIVGTERTFTEVMRCYRLQPQCMSHVYRSVLLSSPTQPIPNGNGNNRNSGALSGTNEERGDLIRFYNTVYVLKVQQFVMRFSNRGSQQNANLTLSPLPLGKSTPISPRRRISDKHSVYIRPLMSSESSVPPSPVKCLAYCFSRSPAKDLRAINTMIQCNRKIGKRILTDDCDDEPPNKVSIGDGIVTRKVQGLVVDRLAAKTLDS